MVVYVQCKHSTSRHLVRRPVFCPNRLLLCISPLPQEEKSHISPLFFKYVHTKYTSCSLSCSYKRFFSAKRRLWRKKLRHYIRTLLCSSTWEVSSCAYKEEGERSSMYICRETGGFKVTVAVFCRLCCVPVSLRIHHWTSSNRVM